MNIGPILIFAAFALGISAFVFPAARRDWVAAHTDRFLKGFISLAVFLTAALDILVAHGLYLELTA